MTVLARVQSWWGGNKRSGTYTSLKTAGGNTMLDIEHSTQTISWFARISFHYVISKMLILSTTLFPQQTHVTEHFHCHYFHNNQFLTNYISFLKINFHYVIKNYVGHLYKFDSLCQTLPKQNDRASFTNVLPKVNTTKTFTVWKSPCKIEKSNLNVNYRVMHF